MQNNVWLWVIVIVVILGGAYWFFTMQPAAAPTEQTTTATGGTDTTNTNTTGGTNVNVGGTVTTGAPMTATITYDGKSFSPSSVTVAKGGTVTWTSSVGTMEVASAQHPTHTSFDGTTRSTHCAAGFTGPKPFDQCVEGKSYSFTFDKTGSWPYHDHDNASAFGKVVVE